jgi:hypothetical protein
MNTTSQRQRTPYPLFFRRALPGPLSEPARARRDPRQPGACRVRRRSTPLCRHPRPQKLLRHSPDHPDPGREPSRARPLRPQPAPGRRPLPTSVRSTDSLTRRAGLLRHPPRPRQNPPPSPTRTCQPARRHPARLPHPPPAFELIEPAGGLATPPDSAGICWRNVPQARDPA